MKVTVRELLVEVMPDETVQVTFNHAYARGSLLLSKEGAILSKQLDARRKVSCSHKSDGERPADAEHGFGDLVERLIHAALHPVCNRICGLLACGKCKKRKAWLNRWIRWPRWPRWLWISRKGRG